MLTFLRSDLAELTAYVPHTEEGLELLVTPSSKEPIQVDHLDTNESPFDLPEELKQKLTWTYQQFIQANRYPDGGHTSLKRAIADYVTESANLPPNSFNAAQISVGNGSDELIRSLLIATCLNGEGAVLVAEPTFSMYAILARTLGIPVVAVGRSPSNFEIALPAARAALHQAQNPAIRVVFVVHPNSPTGNPLTDAEVDWLRSLSDQVLVVIDEAYFEFHQQTLVGELLHRPNWVVLRTFSKAFRLAAHRVGYAIAHPQLIAALEKVRLPYNLPSFTQAAALTALSHRQQLLQAIPQILEQRDHVLSTLVQHSALQAWTSAANFVFVQLKEGITDAPEECLNQICHQLRTQGTLIRHTGGGLRLTTGSPGENQRLLDRLQTALIERFGR